MCARRSWLNWVFFPAVCELPKATGSIGNRSTSVFPVSCLYRKHGWQVTLQALSSLSDLSDLVSVLEMPFPPVQVSCRQGSFGAAGLRLVEVPLLMSDADLMRFGEQSIWS